ncbi:Six-hairpin glycosidase-like protein [Truncatella angustata]|uniref:Six-hairpin glycosidase-like protein n=1 Tax=Truncatella angustata TaxID=152316 RepID=A0A9P8UGN6_9PEZI|nr:Six-hairpin glycosidase-like protein [Truncatella angustata]KAH6651879.1 Six-hairpin glycosidase-like protein [Truncatella angustata]
MSRQQGIMTGAGGSSELLQAGFTQKALTALVAQHSSNKSFVDRVQQYIRDSAASVAPFVSNATKDALGYPMDRLSNGNALLALSGNGTYRNTTVDYAAAAEALRDSIDLNRRNNEGGLWYYTYPYWSYLDGMYSLAPFYTLYSLDAALDDGTVNITALDDMLLQLELLWQHCRNSTSGLLVHGYDASYTAVWANPDTGASPHVWGRSLGWLAMALVDTLEVLGKAKDARPLIKYTGRLREMFQSLAAALIRAADPVSGAWWQVLDRPGDEGNYIESSGSAMFAYALLKGRRLGYLDGVAAASDASQIGIKASAYLTNTFVVDNGNGALGYNGTVSVCSLNSTASYDYYVGQPILYNSVLGSAAYVLASLEMERLQQ